MQDKIDYKGFRFLTQREREVYLLRCAEKTFTEIGEMLNISASAAHQYFVTADKRVNSYEAKQKRKAADAMPVEFPLTLGELKTICVAICSYEDNVCGRLSRNIRADRQKDLAYEYVLVQILRERIKEVLYPSNK